MQKEIPIPSLGESVASGDVLEVLVKVGDTVKKDQGLVELETDKATVIVPSTAAGIVQKVHCKAGDTVQVGSPIVTLEVTEGAGAEAPKSEKPAAPAASPSAPTAPAAPHASSAPTAPAAPHASSAPAQPAAPASTPSAPAPQAAAPTQSAPVSASGPSSATPKAEAVVSFPTTSDDGRLSQVAAGPAIRRFAREVGVDITQVAGTGEHGRITRDDILKVVRNGNRSGGQAVATPSGGQSDGHGPVHIEKMPKIRQTIARKMHESWTTVPRVTNFDDADVTALEVIRKNSKDDYASRGVKLTTMPFLIKAVAMALKSHPVINASVDLEGGQIIYKDYINIGIAVDTERGLVVPVLRNADRLSIPEIARQLGEMADNVRDNNFSVEDLRGGTFTISNLGAIGGTYSTPMVNTPETAILLAGRSRKLPIVTPEDQVAVRLMMPLSLSYDHRLIDGGAAARFLNDVIGYLEAPSRLLLAL